MRNSEAIKKGKGTFGSQRSRGGAESALAACPSSYYVPFRPASIGLCLPALLKGEKIAAAKRIVVTV